MNMVDFEMAKRFSRIDCEIGKTVYIPPQFRLDSGKLIPTYWWCRHFGFENTDKPNYWRRNQ